MRRAGPNEAGGLFWGSASTLYSPKSFIKLPTPTISPPASHHHHLSLVFQCNMSSHGQRGECWCVNPYTGVQIPSSPKVRGDPNCSQYYGGPELEPPTIQQKQTRKGRRPGSQTRRVKASARAMCMCVILYVYVYVYFRNSMICIVDRSVESHMPAKTSKSKTGS